MIYQVANNFAKKNGSFKTPILRSALCDYSDAFIVVKGRISVIGTNNSNRRNEKLPFENNVTRQKYKTKIIGSTKQDKNNREHTNR